MKRGAYERLFLYILDTYYDKLKVIRTIERKLPLERIESLKNQKVKDWKKLQTRKGRKKAQQYILEGFHLVEEAVKAGEEITHLLIREDILQDSLKLNWVNQLSAECIEITDSVARDMADTETSQGVFAVVNITEKMIPQEIHSPYLFLDAVQDPGNVGTLIRSADAAGFEGVVLGEGSADLYNAKTLRAAQGSHLHLPVYQADLKEWIKRFQTEGRPVFGTALDDRAVPYNGEKQIEPFALIVGNEGSGVSSELLLLTDKNLYIPIKGQAESLNVAIAASILMFSLYA